MLRRMGSGAEGEKALEAGLKLYGVRCSRETLRQAIGLLPLPANALERMPILRRIYRVPWINSLWHIDGHHKLIRWNMVIHAGIDGYSRKIMFAKVSDNNRAATVTAAFLEATRKHGLPSRVRADYGTENRGVKAHMEQMRGTYRTCLSMFDHR